MRMDGRKSVCARDFASRNKLPGVNLAPRATDQAVARAVVGARWQVGTGLLKDGYVEKHFTIHAMYPLAL